jgi:hypothetical protein
MRWYAATVFLASLIFVTAGCGQPVSSSGSLRDRWLIKPMSVADIEAKYSIAGGKPFGANNAGWQRLKRAMQPGDELWFYSNPGELWVMHQGEEGIALVRGGHVADWFVCRSN